MNNREIVNYILSGNLKKNEVIKNTEKSKYGEDISYIFNDEFDIWNMNGSLRLSYFLDEYNKDTVYEIIPKEIYGKEMEIKWLKERKNELEKELDKVKKEMEKYK